MLPERRWQSPAPVAVLRHEMWRSLQIIRSVYVVLIKPE
jgi:hypothetical protein